MNFEFITAQRIIFGPGKFVEAGGIANSLGRRALIVIGKSMGAVQRVEPLLTSLTKYGVEYATFSVAGEPTIEVVRTGTQRARDEKCDCVISCGGGSVIDTGKAVAAMLTNGGDPLDYAEVIGHGKSITKPAAPFIAIPTTAGTGSEVTRNAVLGSPEHHVKVSIRSPLMLPTVALVDPELTHGLPPAITATTGLDALTQVIEPFVSIRANPMTDALCREGLRRASRALRRAYEHGQDQGARADMALVSLFGGLALANAGLGVVHGFAGPLGGMYDAPHGALCAALLPHAMAVNEQAAQKSSEVFRRFLEIEQIVGDIEELCQALHVKPLRDLGVRQAEFPIIIEKARASSSMKANPVTLTTDQLQEILERAW